MTMILNFWIFQFSLVNMWSAYFSKNEKSDVRNLVLFHIETNIREYNLKEHTERIFELSTGILGIKLGVNVLFYKKLKKVSSVDLPFTKLIVF